MTDSIASVYAWAGLALCAGGAAFALTRRRSPHSFYAADVYGMTERSHRRFALLSAGFAGGFALALRWPILDVPLLAIYVLLLVLYLSSFARGFSGEDE